MTSIVERGRATRFQKGNTMQTKTSTRKRIRRSKLRKTYEELYKLEPKCLKNIKASVEGEDVDKEVVATSKWVIQQLQTLNRAAVQEEVEINSLRWKGDALAEEAMEASSTAAEEGEDGEEKPTTRFSLRVLPTSKDV